MVEGTRNVTVRVAGEEDIQPLGEMFARAFRADPIMRWLIPSDGEWELYGCKYFTTSLRMALQVGVVYTTRDHAGAAIWYRPPSASLDHETTLRQGLSEARFEWRMASLLRQRYPRRRRLSKAVRESRPEGPHWCLSAVGVDPSRRGEGILTPLLEPILSKCDAEGVEASLHSSNPDNNPIYQRYGFRVTGSIEMTQGPTLRTMLRAPRS